MKPGPNKLRYVGYKGDGVEEFHCLRCGQRIRLMCTASYDPPEFCCYCGTRWELGHVWAEPLRIAVATALADKSGPRVPCRRWSVECRILWGPPHPPSDWERIPGYFPGDRLEFVRLIRRMREDNAASEASETGLGAEYRIVRVEEAA